jgi:hypothetical protein
MDNETHVRLLGEATGRGQQLELCTTQMLARGLSISESKARLLTNAMGEHGALAVLQALAERKECGGLDASALVAWLKKAKAANQARNRVIHSPWIRRGADGEAGFVLTRGSMKLEPRTEKDLRHDISALTAAVVSALELL